MELTQIAMGQGQVNTIHKKDGSSKHFTFLSEILHMVDKQDLLNLYGWVTTYYRSHKPQGASLFLLGDLYVLCDSSHHVGKGFKVWTGQQSWDVVSWQFFPLCNVHMVFTMTGKVLYMWADVSYPITIDVMKQMLEVKLTVHKDMLGNDMTHAEQLVHTLRRSLLVRQELASKYNIG